MSHPTLLHECSISKLNIKCSILKLNKIITLNNKCLNYYPGIIILQSLLI